MAEPTYIFRDGNVYTMVDGKVTASVKEAEFGEPHGGHPIEGEVTMPPAPEDVSDESVCPQCGWGINPQDKFCKQCGSPLDQGINEVGDTYTGEDLPGGTPFDAGHTPRTVAKQTVTTPNGLKGRVLARVPALWGEEVTVRFENGVIKRIPVDTNLTFASAEDSEPETPIRGLEERLAATSAPDRESLVERAKELKSIKVEARQLIAEATDSEAVALDQISVEAGYELREVVAALEHYADLEGKGFEAPAPIEGVVSAEQASTGSSKADWLETTYESMVAEAGAEDFEKLMDEGPEAFIAGLDTDQLADAGTTRVMASREIRSHTAGANEEVRGDYERVWLARVEERRREELASRKEEVRKEAASGEETVPPDESLFI